MRAAVLSFLFELRSLVASCEAVTAGSLGTAGDMSTHQPTAQATACGLPLCGESVCLGRAVVYDSSFCRRVMTSVRGGFVGVCFITRGSAREILR